MIFTYFTFSSSLKFSWHSSFNLAWSTCSFYWCSIFSFKYLWSKYISAEGKTHVILLLLVNIRKYKKMIKTFRNSRWSCSIKEAVLNIFAIFIRKNLIWSLFLTKLFEPRYFPVNIVNILRTPILKNVCEWLLLYVVFNSNEEQHLLVKLAEMR